MNTYKLKIPINKNNRTTRRDILNNNIMIIYIFSFFKVLFEELILYLDIELKKYIHFGNYYFYYFI